jgi:hypothetical protein
MNDVAACAGWWWPFANACIVTPRPSLLCRDGNGRLHSESSASIAYTNAWAIYAIHGVLVDEQVVMRPETQTIRQIEAESSAEVRRVRIERYGWERYLKESGSQAIHSRRNDRDAQTEELYLLKDGARRFVCSDPSTGRRYSLGVPNTVTTCEQAQSWMSHGLDRLAVHRS